MTISEDERATAQAAPVLTVFSVSERLSPEAIDTLRQAIARMAAGAATVVSRDGDIALDSFNAETGARLRRNLKIREDRTIIQGLTLAVEVSVNPTWQYRLACWSANVLAAFMSRVTGIPIAVSLRSSRTE